MTKPNEYDASGPFSRADVQNRLVLTAAEERILGLERLLSERIDSLKLRFEEKKENDEIKLRLQAAEYERRLDMLNHENERILKAAEASVSLDKFEGFKERMEQRTAAIEREQTSFGGRTAGTRATMAALVALLALLMQLAGFIFMVFHK